MTQLGDHRCRPALRLTKPDADAVVVVAGLTGDDGKVGGPGGSAGGGSDPKQHH